MILPGGTIGVLGGGQLARMMCLDARRMGYKTIVWSGTPTAEPTEGVADRVINLPFDNSDALADFCNTADVATVEFENIPASTLQAVESLIPLRPGADIVAISGNRSREKALLKDNSIPCAPFALIRSLADLREAHAAIGPDAVLKTVESGYDGKGQVRLTEGADLEAAWKAVDEQFSVLEGFIDFECEVSVLVARGVDGETAVYPVSENLHRHHILDFSIVPARVSEATASEAQAIAVRLADILGYVGLLAVEFFVQSDGSVLVNELAPRPHNSGHYTMDSSATSQFEQQIRAVCGVPLGSVEQLTPAVMVNLLGDMWHGSVLDERAILDVPGAKLHVYGKSNPSGRRKLGHVNIVGGELADVKARAETLKSHLLKG